MNEYYEITIIYASRNPRMKQHISLTSSFAFRYCDEGAMFFDWERGSGCPRLYIILRLRFVTRFRSFLLDYDQNTAQYGSKSDTIQDQVGKNITRRIILLKLIRFDRESTLKHLQQSPQVLPVAVICGYKHTVNTGAPCVFAHYNRSRGPVALKCLSWLFKTFLSVQKYVFGEN